jgi:hypothetical protein
MAADERRLTAPTTWKALATLFSGSERMGKGRPPACWNALCDSTLLFNRALVSKVAEYVLSRIVVLHRS